MALPGDSARVYVDASLLIRSYEMSTAAARDHLGNQHYSFPDQLEEN